MLFRNSIILPISKISPKKLSDSSHEMSSTWATVKRPFSPYECATRAVGNCARDTWKSPSANSTALSLTHTNSSARIGKGARAFIRRLSERRRASSSLYARVCGHFSRRADARPQGAVAANDMPPPPGPPPPPPSALLSTSLARAREREREKQLCSRHFFMCLNSIWRVYASVGMALIYF